MSYQTSSADFSVKTLYDKQDDLLSRGRSLGQNGDGAAFLNSLSGILSSPSVEPVAQGTTLKPSSGSVLGLKNDAESYGERLQSRINDFKMLENNAPSQSEWNKAFAKDSSDSGWSLLENLGSGLLTAAKIAGAVAIL